MVKDWYQLFTFAQGITMTIGMVIVFMLTKTFRAGGAWRDFETFSNSLDELKDEIAQIKSDITRLINDSITVVDRNKIEMRAELDRYYDRVVRKDIESLQKERDRILDVIERLQKK